jgi:hypothetical protein
MILFCAFGLSNLIVDIHIDTDKSKWHADILSASSHCEHIKYIDDIELYDKLVYLNIELKNWIVYFPRGELFSE